MADRRERFERQVEAIVRVLRDNTPDRRPIRRSSRVSGAGRAGRQRGTKAPGASQPTPTG
jgi:hypothetical protein